MFFPRKESQDGALTLWIALSLVCGGVFATALWTILFVAVRWRRKRQSRRLARQRKAEQGKAAVTTQRSRAVNGTFAVRAPTPDADGGSSGSGRLPVRVYVTNGVIPTVEPSSSPQPPSRMFDRLMDTPLLLIRLRCCLCRRCHRHRKCRRLRLRTVKGMVCWGSLREGLFQWL